MDISSNDLLLIRRALLHNSAILFTGAGFSRDAKNALGKGMPSGDELSEQLWHHLKMPGSRGKETLPRLFEATLKQAHAPLRDLLRNNFECKSLASWYQIPTAFYWYRIYSTNIDDALEVAYRNQRPRLRVINGQKDDYSERDQFLEEIQYIKLNGLDWQEPKEITFGFRQYAKRATDSPVWYEQFARDFATHVTIFVGTELDEQLFWNAVELRGRRFAGGESRPRSFLIRPSISPVDAANLKEFNITPISSTAKEFFELLAANTSDEKDQAKVLSNSQPGYATLRSAITDALSSRETKMLQQFYSVFTPVQIPDKAPQPRKSFLLGAAPDWNSIHANLDAARDCNNEIAKLIEESFASKTHSIVSVTGPAGSGKSTALKRIAVGMKAAGRIVLWSNSEATIPDHVFASSIDKLNGPAVIFIDNVSQVRQAFISYIKASAAGKNSPTFVVADRANRIAFFEKQLSADFPVVGFRMPLLSSGDVDRIIDKLGEFGLLGKLQGVPRSEQRREFSVRAGKQLLVAMREATSGADFDVIIEGELQALEADELKVIYLSACLATAAGYALSTEQIVALTDLSPSECLSVLDNGLKDVVIPIGGKPGLWIARHRIIADIILDRLAPRELLMVAYIRLLEALSRDLPRPLKTSGRIFRLYREVINHATIWSRFRQSIESARKIFESIRPYCEDDHHFWLQYGSLELEYGELGLAEVYVSAAESLAPSDNFVQNTKASLLYRRATASDRIAEAYSLRESAREILHTQIKRMPDDVYPPHILCSHELKFIKTWTPKRTDLKRNLEELRAEVDAFVSTHRYSERMAAVQKQIHDAYLESAIAWV